jgi:hypothetical protein
VFPDFSRAEHGRRMREFHWMKGLQNGKHDAGQHDKPHLPAPTGIEPVPVSHLYKPPIPLLLFFIPFSTINCQYLYPLPIRLSTSSRPPVTADHTVGLAKRRTQPCRGSLLASCPCDENYMSCPVRYFPSGRSCPPHTSSKLRLPRSRMDDVDLEWLCEWTGSGGDGHSV